MIFCLFQVNDLVLNVFFVLTFCHPHMVQPRPKFQFYDHLCLSLGTSKWIILKANILYDLHFFAIVLY